MRRLWVTGPDAFKRARAAAQTRADLASRPVLVWRVRRTPPTYLVDVVPEAWSEVDAVWTHHPTRIRSTYHRQIKVLLDKVSRAIMSGARSQRPVGREPMASLRRVEDELSRMLARLSCPDGPQDLSIPSSDPDVLVDETGQYRLLSSDDLLSPSAAASV